MDWSKSTTDILLQTPFIGRIILALPMIEDNSHPTFYVDGKVIGFNSEFAESLTQYERDAVRIHECLHILLGHHVRRGSRDPFRWNTACDYEVNPYVTAAGYTLPDDALSDVKYLSMSAEAIYELLPSSIKGCGWGNVRDEGDDATSMQQAKDNWKSLVASMQWGDLPGDLSRKLTEEIKPNPTMREKIEPLLQSAMPSSDETWLTRSRRYDLLPGETTSPDGYIVCCVDTSGSIDDMQIREFAECITGFAGIDRIDIIFGDCKVQKIIENISTIDEIISAFGKAEGGGGTDFKPLLRRAEQEQPDAIIYFTDGYGDFGNPSGLPVIWIMNTDAVAPWGIACTS